MELLCIQTHSQGAVKAGNVYPLISDKSPCKCNDVVNVGISDKLNPWYNGSSFNRCIHCNTVYKSDGYWRMSKTLFVEIGEQDESETYKQEELIKIEL